MGKALEVQPGELKKAAKDYLRQADEAGTFRSNFESGARLSADDFGNTSASPELASTYEETYNDILTELQGLSKKLRAFGESLQDAGRTFAAMERANTIKVKKGDTLWDIADKKLGDPTRYPEIAKNNPKIKDPDLIYPGEKIKVRPERDLKVPWRPPVDPNDPSTWPKLTKKPPVPLPDSDPDGG